MIRKYKFRVLFGPNRARQIFLGVIFFPELQTYLIFTETWQQKGRDPCRHGNFTAFKPRQHKRYWEQRWLIFLNKFPFFVPGVRIVGVAFFEVPHGGDKYGIASRIGRFAPFLDEVDYLLARLRKSRNVVVGENVLVVHGEVELFPVPELTQNQPKTNPKIAGPDNSFGESLFRL